MVLLPANSRFSRLFKQEKQICSFPDVDEVFNAEGEDRSPWTRQRIDESLQYACVSWNGHFDCTKSTQRLKVMPILRRFLEEKLSFGQVVRFNSAQSVTNVVRMMRNRLDVCYISLFFLFSKTYRAGPRSFLESAVKAGFNLPLELHPLPVPVFWINLDRARWALGSVEHLTGSSVRRSPKRTSLIHLPPP